MTRPDMFNQTDADYGLSFERAWGDSYTVSGSGFIESYYFGNDSEDEQREFLEELFSSLAESDYDIDTLVFTFSNENIDSYNDYSVESNFSERKPKEYALGAYISVMEIPQPIAIEIDKETSIELDEDEQFNFFETEYEGQSEMAATETFYTPLEVIKRYGYSARLLELAEIQGQLLEAHEVLRGRGIHL
ncbi:hypothetical protein ACFP81_13280 [Deinococcus lacus]|uniref:Uncharacterized protein n=1 Tax=Deinococcus lacus TaxID=392561 RepID=A0ABW1YE77_9DEIO